MRRPFLSSQLRFLIGGVGVVAVDFFLYTFLRSWGVGLSFSKGLGWLGGLGASYGIHSRWTFPQKEKKSFCFKKSGAFLLLAGLCFVLNVGINQEILAWWPEKVLFAFGVATGVSSLASYLGMRFFVFKPTD